MKLVREGEEDKRLLLLESPIKGGKEYYYYQWDEGLVEFKLANK